MTATIVAGRLLASACLCSVVPATNSATATIPDGNTIMLDAGEIEEASSNETKIDHKAANISYSNKSGQGKVNVTVTALVDKQIGASCMAELNLIKKYIRDWNTVGKSPIYFIGGNGALMLANGTANTSTIRSVYRDNTGTDRYYLRCHVVAIDIRYEQIVQQAEIIIKLEECWK